MDDTLKFYTDVHIPFAAVRQLQEKGVFTADSVVVRAILFYTKPPTPSETCTT